MTSWPPRPGQLWMAADRWPRTDLDHAIEGGELVMVIRGEARDNPRGDRWWQGEVLAPAGKRFIRATEGDLIPADDPRIGATLM